jgi:hypothetical protein
MPDEEQEAVREATDEQRLLPGEKSASRSGEDAKHWIEVYSQLRETKIELIANLKEMMARQSQEAQDELERSDVRVLELQVARFERRLAFWRNRLSELDGSGKAGEVGDTRFES